VGVDECWAVIRNRNRQQTLVTDDGVSRKNQGPGYNSPNAL